MVIRMGIHSGWLGKPYYSLDAYFKSIYGGKCYKLAVDAGCTCPNRDGVLDSRGCIFCSTGGSGDFSEHICADEGDAQSVILDSIERGRQRFNKASGERYVIYFQAFTNTYGDIHRLEQLWAAALSVPSVVGISIGTRPDCLGEEVLSALGRLKGKYVYSDSQMSVEKFIWIELGLQTIWEDTAQYIRRHYPLLTYDKACAELGRVGIPYITHVILGLPGESRDKMLDTISYVCRGNVCKPFGIKLQLLHVLEHTDLARDFLAGAFEAMTMDEYIGLVIDCVERIDEDIVLHRVTGDGPKNLLIEPAWSADKKRVLNTLHHAFKERGAWQGRLVTDKTKLSK